jgi:outer membrane murein-binding lipoprotein Lpp
LIRIVSTILILQSFKAKSSTTTTGTISISNQKLQTKIDDLSSQVNVFNSLISKFQSRLNVLETPPTSTTTTTPTITEPDPTVIDNMTAKIEKLTTQIRLLQYDMLALQENLKGNTTNIGTNSMYVNGLDVTFITNGINVGITDSSIPGTVQFAIKITDLSNSIVSNLDVTGTITSSENISSNIAAGYPQITDAAALCTMAYSNTSSNTINFEAYGGKGGYPFRWEARSQLDLNFLSRLQLPINFQPLLL